MNTKVAILGKLVSKFNAPFEDMSYDIWTLNYHNIEPPRVTLWFDLHAKNPNPKADITRANYPFKEAETLVSGNYYNNTFSYMIAYAILKGYKEIEIYGCRFIHDQEVRAQQRQSVRELVMFARGRGIKVSAPVDECLLEGYDYYGL